MEDTLEGEYHIHNISHELLDDAARAFGYRIQIIEYTELEEYKEFNDPVREFWMEMKDEFADYNIGDEIRLIKIDDYIYLLN